MAIKITKGSDNIFRDLGFSPRSTWSPPVFGLWFLMVEPNLPRSQPPRLATMVIVS